ncbi:hypothetical protein PAHAL_4G084700 [Panicum hallii]|uniref:Uncharacterized protein n=1 Tax=Panicum hallii TaxID=206008 RepID=A0A2T8JCB0_9POAL|nr:hypothetical protein PAHAL_4G084700 [Panicum hallii]
MDGPPLSPLAAMGLGSVHGQTRLSNWLHRLLGNGDRHSAIPRRLQDGPSSGAETMLPELELIAWCEGGREGEGDHGRPICLHPSASKNRIRSDG